LEFKHDDMEFKIFNPCIYIMKVVRLFIQLMK